MLCSIAEFKGEAHTGGSPEKGNKTPGVYPVLCQVSECKPAGALCKPAGALWLSLLKASSAAWARILQPLSSGRSRLKLDGMRDWHLVSNKNIKFDSKEGEGSGSLGGFVAHCPGSICHRKLSEGRWEVGCRGLRSSCPVGALIFALGGWVEKLAELGYMGLFRN